jgi:hypothetical protein
VRSNGLAAQEIGKRLTPLTKNPRHHRQKRVGATRRGRRAGLREVAVRGDIPEVRQAEATANDHLPENGAASMKTTSKLFRAIQKIQRKLGCVLRFHRRQYRCRSEKVEYMVLKSGGN